MQQELIVDVIVTPVYEEEVQYGWSFSAPEGYLIYIPGNQNEEESYCKEIIMGVDYDPSTFPYKAILQK